MSGTANKVTKSRSIRPLKKRMKGHPRRKAKLGYSERNLVIVPAARSVLLTNGVEDLESFSWASPLLEYQTEWVRRSPLSGKVSEQARPWRSFEHYKSASNVLRKYAVFDTLPTSCFVIGAARPPNHRNLIGEFDKNFADQFGPMCKPFDRLTSLSLLGDNGQRVVPPPSDLGDLVLKSLQTLVPKVRKELSLLNSIIELKDFLTLKRTMSKVKEAVVLLLKKGVGRSTFKTWIELAADVYLQMQFNILPLLSDIQGIDSALSSAKRRLLDDVKHSGEPRVAHFVYRWDEAKGESRQEEGNWQFVEDCVPVWDAVAQTNTVVTPSRQVFRKASEFHAQLQYTAEYTEYQKENVSLLSRLDALGVNFNPTIIWNAIPWSFVVDWVMNVSSFLDSWRVGFMDPKITMLQYLWSIKRVRDTLLTLKWENGTDLGVQETRQVKWMHITETAYRREVGLPPYSSFLTSGLSPKEFSLATALAITRRTKHKGKR